MGFIIVCMICVTIGAIAYKSAEYEKVFNGIMALTLSSIFGALIAFLLLPGIGVEYKTESVRPLAKMKDGGYIKLVPSEGDVAFIYRPKGGYTQVLDLADEDTDDVYYYQTHKTPRVEQRCGYIEDWVFPWDVTTYDNFHGCDINIYVPAHKGVLLK